MKTLILLSIFSLVFGCTPRDAKVLPGSSKSPGSNPGPQGGGAFLSDFSAAALVVEKQTEALLLLQKILDSEQNNIDVTKMPFENKIQEEVHETVTGSTSVQWMVEKPSADQWILKGASVHTVKITKPVQSEMIDLKITETAPSKWTAGKSIKIEKNADGFVLIFDVPTLMVRNTGARFYDNYDLRWQGELHVAPSDDGFEVTQNSASTVTIQKVGDGRPRELKPEVTTGFQFHLGECLSHDGDVVLGAGKMTYNQKEIKHANGVDALIPCEQRPLFDFSRLLGL